MKRKKKERESLSEREVDLLIAYRFIDFGMGILRGKVSRESIRSVHQYLSLMPIEDQCWRVPKL